jgi:hypothetical protein
MATLSRGVLTLTSPEDLAKLINGAPIAVRREQFDFDSPNMTITLMVSDLLEAMESGQVPYTKHLVDVNLLLPNILQHGNFDMDYVKNMTARRADTPILIICGDENNSTHVLADGQHRVMALALDGVGDVKVHMVNWADWQDFALVTRKDN